MIKVAVKHWLYDFCIDIIFNRIKTNFKNTKICGMPKVGEFYSKVSHKYDDEHYYNCVVKNVERRRNGQGESYYIIYLKFEYCEGIVFEEEEWVTREFEKDFEGYEQDEIDEIFSGRKKPNFKKLYDTEDIDSYELKDLLSLNLNYYVFYK